MKNTVNTIIFTDLDGTLLHPETYSFEPARQALDLIKSRNIPLILCSSKTRSELELYAGRLNIAHPYISENGGGIVVPKNYFSPEFSGEIRGDRIMMTVGLPYSRIRKEFIELRTRLGLPVRGFGDMDVEEVAALTGLPREEAVLARQRDFSEPFIFPESEDKFFLRAAQERGLQWTRGRLYCLMGDHDKGGAVRLLKKAYENEHGRIISIGVGDALNDVALLQEVDIPILVQKQDRTYERSVSVAGLVLAEGIGPEGWNSALLALLKTSKKEEFRIKKEKDSHS